MSDTVFWSMLAIAMLIAIALGALLFLFGAAPIFDLENGAQSQTLTVSNTLTDDNCNQARQVGDNACNANISQLPWSSPAAMLLGGFMVFMGLVSLTMITAMSR